MEPDRDGVARRVPLFISAAGHLVPNFAREMLRVGSGAGAVGIVTGSEGVLGARLGTLFLPTDSRGRMYPYFTPSYVARYISAGDLLNRSYDPNPLQSAAVVFGASPLRLAARNPT